VEVPVPVAAGAAAPDVVALWSSAKDGDRGALAAIYRWLAPVVHGIAVARGGAGDADDVVQETFLAVARGLAGLRDPRAFPAWVRSVAANVATDRLRRRARGPRRVAMPDDVAARGTSDGDDGALRARVLARIQELPEPYRETLVWRLVEGLTGPEIADRTGLTPGSVRVNLCRGMALLRPLLASDGWAKDGRR
jgi:RNA polymerase sigma-70 factor (ECF subfamily)